MSKKYATSATLNKALLRQTQAHDTPEARLLVAVIVQAAADALRPKSSPTENSARSFFGSDLFRKYCELLNLDDEAVRRTVGEWWVAMICRTFVEAQKAA